MTINYRKAYLTDGTQVKITEELFQQLKQWEKEGYDIPFQYTDILKQEDNKMINANRQYYRNNISLEEQMSKEQSNPSLVEDTKFSVEDTTENIDRRNNIVQILKACTETQRRRFIKHYYLGYSYVQIGKQEGCSDVAVHLNIQKVEQKLLNQVFLV